MISSLAPVVHTCYLFIPHLKSFGCLVFSLSSFLFSSEISICQALRLGQNRKEHEGEARHGRIEFLVVKFVDWEGRGGEECMVGFFLVWWFMFEIYTSMLRPSG